MKITHSQRKEMKKKGFRNIQKHYLIFLAIGLLASFAGAEYGDSIVAFRSQNYETVQEVSAASGTQLVGLPGQMSTVLTSMFLNDNAGAQQAVENRQKVTDSSNPMFGHTRGVLAGIVNSVGTGSFLVTAVLAIRNIVGSQSAAAAILIVISMLFAFLLWALVVQVIPVISRRLFLEGRTYRKLPPQRFLFLLKSHYWVRAAMTMTLTTIFEVLWSFTIIGGFIKRYSYYMVPYIVAENPTIKPRQAITLSRKMMNGHKWECFVFDLTFIGWGLLKMLTAGLSGLFFSDMYMVAAFSEYYTAIRQQSMERGIPDAELLNDVYLYEIPDKEMRRQTYQDVWNELNEKDNTDPIEEMQLKGVAGWFVRTFGVVLYHDARERRYQDRQEKAIQTHNRKEAAKGNCYPARLYPIPEKERNGLGYKIHFIRHYSICSLILIFFLFSFAGWLWEGCLHMMMVGNFVNRGVMHGPWLPIYGSGGVLILVLLNKLRKNPVAEFVAAIVLSGFVEYFTAYYLELTHDGKKWWDYSGYYLNLDGRICAEGLLMFGIGGMVMVYFLAPVVDHFLKKIPVKVLVLLSVVLLTAFTADKIYSSKHPNEGEGVTDISQSAPAQQELRLDRNLQAGLEKYFVV